MKRTLDWRPSYDERSRNFRAVEGIEDKPLRNRRWACDVVLDQGQEGACVGFGWSHELIAKPKIVPNVDNDFARAIYHRAQQLDDTPGENYSGTSVLAGAKAIQECVNAEGQPLIGAYRWAFGVEDILKTVSYHGPVVLGISWYYNMYEPDENNYIHVEGKRVGGHCILLNGQRLVPLDSNKPLTIGNLNLDQSRIKLHNSWGEGWGIDGEGFLSLSDLYKLIEDDGGEACIPSHRVV